MENIHIILIRVIPDTYGGSDYAGFDGSSNNGGSIGGTDPIFFNGNPQRVSSHLKWRDLNIWQIEAQRQICHMRLVSISAQTATTAGLQAVKIPIETMSGLRASEGNGYGNEAFYGGGSDFQFARSHSKVKGYVYDVELAVGYQFKLCDDNFSVAPLVGYSWHGQHLKDRHLRQSFFYSDDFTEGGYVAGARSQSSDSYHNYTFESSSVESYYSYGGDHSKYHTRWDGVFIGFDFDYRFGCCCEWDLFGGYEFHFAQYHAKGHWNLRDDLFDGFRHHAKDAYGNTFDIGIQWDFCECWTLALKGEFQWWWADHGRDRALIAKAREGDVKRECLLSIPLRDIKWQSAGVSVDLGMVF